ncbi:hypothetical protein ACHAW6_008990 [Cyclotella cf. meneghiniana]
MKNFVTEEKLDRREIYRKLERHRQESLEKKRRANGTAGDGSSLPYEESNIGSLHSYRESEETHSEEEVGEEDYEAMNQALSSPPVAWWQMRKQWQNKPNVAKFLGRMGAGGNADQEEGDDIDSSYRLGNLASRPVMETVSHPVMLADPSSIGYDGGAFRQNPFSGDKNKKNKGNYPNMVMYVPKSMLHKRRLNQLAYIAGAMCLVVLFAFLIQQRKLANYAMIESPMSLSAYLAGEQMDPSGRVSVDSIRLIPVPKNERTSLHEEAVVKGGEEFAGKGWKKESSSSTIEMRASHRYNSLRTLFISQGITSDETFDNPLSPQHAALHWMAYQDLHPGPPLGYGHDEYAAKKMIQRYALAVTYYATNGPGWYNQINFLSDRDECEWNEITKEEGYFIGAGSCNDDGLVTALALWSNNLMGALPEEVGTLSTITTFSLYDNNMRGPPPRILEKLSGLKILYLNKNQFVGNLDYLCGLQIEVMKADCGERGSVTCSCCTECGWNEHRQSP